MFQQELAPLGSLTVSALVALLPLLTIFVLLGVLRLQGALGRAGRAGRGHPRRDIRLRHAAPAGPAGRHPGRRVRAVPDHVDRRSPPSGSTRSPSCQRPLRGPARGVQPGRPTTCGSRPMVIAFCFGGLLEALAGFGAPVAITGVMLMALGFSAHPRRGPGAAGQHRAGRVRRDRHPDHHRGQADRDPVHRYRCRRRAAGPAAGGRSFRWCWCSWSTAGAGLRQVWPAALVTGVSFGLAQFVSATCHLGGADRHHRLAVLPGGGGGVPAGLDPDGQRRGGPRGARRRRARAGVDLDQRDHRHRGRGR